MVELWHWLAELAWWLRLGISIAAFIGGALLTGWLLGLLAAISGQEASKRTVLWSRLGGGTIGGILAWLLLHFGSPGSGPGDGGTEPGTDTKPNTAEVLPPDPAPPSSAVFAPARDELPKEKLILRVKLLGPNSEPPFVPPDKYFLVLGVVSATSANAPMIFPSTWPKEPINAEAILQRVEQIRQESTLEAVELHVTPYSTSLRHNEVSKLRRLLMEAKVRFDSSLDTEQPKYSPLVDR
jgi:hypothetical protein